MKAISVILLICFSALSYGKIIQTFYHNIEDFKVQNPEVELIEMQVNVNEIDDSRSYSLGVRQTGDVVVANVSNKKKWAQPQNVTTTLSYPSSGGQGAFLTYILINCEQSSNLGRAYVTSGGVQQHYVQIVIESQVTTYFNYASFFYGIK